MPQIGDDDARRHAVALADLIEQLAVGARAASRPSRISFAGQDAREVFLERKDRFRLRAVALDDDRLGSLTSASAASTISCADARARALRCGRRRATRRTTAAPVPARGRRRKRARSSTDAVYWTKRARAMLGVLAMVDRQAAAASPSTSAGRTIVKLLVAAALVWIWLTLVQLVLVLVVAVLLAVTLNPVVDWFERHGWPRWGCCGADLRRIAGVPRRFWLVGVELDRRSGVVCRVAHCRDREEVLDRLPTWLRDAIGAQSESADSSQPRPCTRCVSAARRSRRSSSACSADPDDVSGGRSAGDARLAAGVRAEGQARQGRADLAEAQRVIFAYVAGNVLTSVMAFSSS